MDKKICCDCQQEFQIYESDGEKAFYQSKSFTEPRRCKPCRVLRKQKSSDGFKLDLNFNSFTNYIYLCFNCFV